MPFAFGHCFHLTILYEEIYTIVYGNNLNRDALIMAVEGRNIQFSFLLFQINVEMTYTA